MIEIKEGAVFRDGERIGAVEGESLIVPEKLHHNVVKKLEKETGLTVVVAPTALDTSNAGAHEQRGNPAAAVSQAASLMLSHPPHVNHPIFSREVSSKVVGPEEPAPPKDHRGDKTPAFVEWMFRNRPEEAATRYANRIISRP